MMKGKVVHGEVSTQKLKTDETQLAFTGNDFASLHAIRYRWWQTFANVG